MSFEEVATLDADVTTALGGQNKKTGKKNPTSAEGYYLGFKKVDSKKAKNGFAYLHILQTSKGNLGVWGKTDMDRKLTAVTPGTMVRITHTGFQPTPNGEMYKFKVEIDKDNTIDVGDLSAQDSGGVDESTFGEGSEAIDQNGTDEDLNNEVDQEPPPAAAKRSTGGTSAERTRKVQELLNRK